MTGSVTNRHQMPLGASLSDERGVGLQRTLSALAMTELVASQRRSLRKSMRWSGRTSRPLP
jgi:hypothetical protein